MSVTVAKMVGCPRCTKAGHAGVVFRELARPMETPGLATLTHWAPCPTNGDPILMCAVEGDVTLAELHPLYGAPPP